MNPKNEAHKKLILHIKQELDHAKQSYESTKGHTQDADMKQEGKYDTRSIEAGYLAGAKKLRVDELEQELKLLEEVNLKEFSDTDEIESGALVELKLNDKIQTYFLLATAGGNFIKVADKTVMVTTIFSPLGSAMLGLTKGDTFEVETPKVKREYEILNVL